MYVQNLPAAYAFAAAWRLSLHGLPPFFVPLCGLFYNSLLILGAGLSLVLGFTFLSAHFLIVIMSYHITLSFLL